MVKKSFFFFCFVVFLSCRSMPERSLRKEQIPGIDTMKRYGKKLSLSEILLLSGNIMRENGFIASVSSATYYEILYRENQDPVFITENILYDENGYAVEIQGRVETPSRYLDFVEKGGIGIPVYEAREKNEFSTVFGRKADLAIREGVIVRRNPLEKQDIYHLNVGSQTYDVILNSALLFQCYELVREAYLNNLMVELEGMVMNSEAREAILMDMERFRKKRRNLTSDDTAMMIVFMEANEGYLKELSHSNRKALQRLEESKKLLHIMDEACTVASERVSGLFAEIALDIAHLTFQVMSNILYGFLQGGEEAVSGVASSAVLITNKIQKYVWRNAPKMPGVELEDLRNMSDYSNYLYHEYRKYKKRNDALERQAERVIEKMRIKEDF